MHPHALLDAAAELLRRLLVFDHPADAVAASYFREQRAAGPRERARMANAAYAVLRRKPFYEHLATHGLPGAAAPVHLPLHRRLAMLALGLAGADTSRPSQADRPDTDATAKVFTGLSDAEAAWLAACRQADPATLPPACRHNLPDWLATALQAQAGSDFWPLAHALLESAPLDLRVNLLKQKRPSAQASIAKDAIETIETPYSPWGLRVTGKPSLARLSAWQQGVVEVQDEGSQLLALLLEARRGELVVDFCAGAGGKTLALGAMMRNTGRLYAFDTSAHRLEGLKPRLSRSGLGNVHTAAIAHERDARIKALTGKADRVLVDAPCSGLGTLRRAPDLKWRTAPGDIAALAQRQRAIVQSAAALVKPGGRLIYATCSLLQEENEAVAEALAPVLRDFVPLHAGERLAALKVPGADTLATPAGHLRLWPHRHGTDGFFAAVWQRRG
ncbi:RsmB/NOP family class I SAM-dependent RNA methyltransferase [Comamonadaceae bacterium OH2545_COT-014]|nr:RsmB/NOP family class I SAM-dependent RNA methyltransferase [Comamonadaceae bacterium OH2545_COT-014]